MEASSDPILYSHLPEYAAEFIGTAFMVFAGLSAVVFDFAPGSPMTRWIPDSSARLLVTGMCFAATGSLVAISPLGKLSGAHINPSVSLAFYLHGTMKLRDLAGYVVAQMLGGIVGAATLWGVWKQRAAALHDGMTLLRPGLPIWAGIACEAACTALAVALIFTFVSTPRLLRWTPLMTWILFATLVWREAPLTGTSLNPARSFGPALIDGTWTHQWIYLVAPPLGAVLGWGVYVFMRSEDVFVRTAKLFHSPRYRNIFHGEAAGAGQAAKDSAR